VSSSQIAGKAESPAAAAVSERACVRFVLDGQVVSLPGLLPTRTVLEVLREELGRTGTKEGCAEGDCGACSVVVGELDQASGEVRHRAVNACIQLAATLDGRELLTVESLSAPGEPLHPVQRALVECHASQCGFCTPGFAMALFSLFKQERCPSRREIDDALAGNLCRCTGYRPIVAAAERMRELAEAEARIDVPWLRLLGSARARAASPGAALLPALARSDTLQLSTPEGAFWAPISLAAGCALYAQHPDACVLAGGTDVGLWVTKQGRALPKLLYLGNVAELKRCSLGADALEIGAGAALSDALPQLSAEYPGLDELCARFASPPIRNAGTLGGNVANASPVGDLPPALLALDATLVLRQGTLERELPLHEFFLDYQRTARAPGELLTHVRVPRARPGQIAVAYKVSKRFDQDIAALCGAFSADLREGLLSRVRMAFGGMAAVPKRAYAAERALEGQALSEATLSAAMAALAQNFRPISDLRATAAYRMQVARNLLRRFFLACAGDPDARGLYREAR
jgi:xanthine dehydrogenase small subunit